MAERALFFDSVSGDREYTSTDFAKAFGGIVKNGVVPNSMNELQCRFGTGMEILVDTGEAWINGRYYANENEQKSLMIPTADATYSRIDRVVIRLDSNIEIRSIETIVKTGTPAENPVAPELQQDSLIYEFPLCQYTVEANASNPSKLLDERQFIQTNELVMSEAFNDFVKGLEPHGGVVRIEAEDLPSTAWNGVYYKRTERLDEHSSGAYIVAEPGTTLEFDFVGTGLAFYTQAGTRRSISAYIDNNDVAIEVNIPFNLRYTTQCLVKIVEGLTYGKHTIRFEVSGDEPLIFNAFDIIQTTDNTLHVNSGITYTSGIRKNINENNHAINLAQLGSLGRVDTLVTDKNGQIYFVQGTDGENELAYRVEENGLISKRYRNKHKEWFEDKVKIWNNGITGYDTTGWAYGSVDGRYSGNVILYSEKPDATYYIGFVGNGLILITRKLFNAGIVAVSIDGGDEIYYDLYTAENQENSGIFQYPLEVATNLPFGYHEVRFRVTGDKNENSDGTHFHVDAFDIYLPKEIILPSNTQPICNVLIPPLAGTSPTEIRPNSNQQAGWIRYDDNEGVVYNGFNWSRLYTSIFHLYSNSTLMENKNTNGIDYAEFTFIGTGIRLISSQRDSYGIVAISVDNGTESLVDLFIDSSSVLHQRLVYEQTDLPFGVHTIKIRSTMTKNANSNDARVYIDAFEVYRPYYLVEDLRTTLPIKLNPVVSGEEGVKVIQNENGTAWLYPDGRAECWYLKPENLTTTSASGNLYFTTTGSMYYPIIWATGKPEVILPMSQISGSINVWMNITLVYETYCTGLLWSSVSYAEGYPGFYAKGRWK